jgi:uncharacterized RDD family membrane protein YckC
MNTTNPYAPPQAAVQDVVDSDNQELAGRGIRLLTTILDSIILVAMVYLPLIFATAANAGLQARGARAGAGALGLLVLAGLIGWIWLTVLFVTRNGQSIGKKITGIKVVRTDGSKPSLGRIVLMRNILNLMLNVVPLYGFVDALMIFGDKQQCAHDKIADTVVIRA